MRFVFFILSSAALSLLAQTTGVISGTATDPSGSVVPAVRLTLSGQMTRTADSDNRGAFSIAGIPGGEYTLRAAAPGFALYETKVTISGGLVVNLSIKLQVATDRQEVTVTADDQAAVDPANNAAAVVMKEEDLALLSDNADELQADLLAIAGPGAGANGGQIIVDGFSGGQLPPKESIREVRINSNPFSAEFDRSGQGRVEIFTKPGTDRLRGSFQYNISDNMWNARNAFSPQKPDNRAQQYNANVGGALGKKASITINAMRSRTDDTNFINALTLNERFEPVRLAVNQPNPNFRYQFTPTLDVALTPNQTLQLRYSQSRNFGRNNGVGGFNLSTRGNTTVSGYHAFIIVHTIVLGARAVNETRYLYQRTDSRNQPNSSAPGINVLDAFNGGGGGGPLNANDNLFQEIQNYTTYTRGRHIVRFGARVKGSVVSSHITGNFNGSYTFTSIDSYATTQRGIAAGLTIPQIRALGGGARQYSVTGGTPDYQVMMWDAGPFIQEDWRARPNVTVSLGLRYEFQTNISDGRAIAPRIGIAWGLGKSGPRGQQPKTVLRAGVGAFYDRVSYDLKARELRQSGSLQPSFVVQEPSFFPVAPPVSALVSNRQPQAIYRQDATLIAPTLYTMALTLERQLRRNVSLSANYYFHRGTHQLRSRNINAPLAGVYPFGAPGQLFVYESSANFRQSQLVVNLNSRLSPKLQIVGSYTWGKANSDSDGAGSFPANNYDLSTEYGRAGFDIRHRVQLSGNADLPFKIKLSPNIGWQSATPFNITSGVDLNGDTNFNDRPAFATDLARPSVRRTPWGVFDVNPLPGQQIIPRNYGFGFPRFEFNARISRAWTMGEVPKGSKTRRPTFTVGMQVRNVTNYVNRRDPNGNLSSALFWTSARLIGGELGFESKD